MYQDLGNFYGYPFQLLGNPFTAIVLGGTKVVAVRVVRMACKTIRVFPLLFTNLDLNHSELNGIFMN